MNCGQNLLSWSALSAADQATDRSASSNDPWSWWRDTLGSPIHVCSPMVDQSELAYRMLLRQLYAEGQARTSNAPAAPRGLLCYTPMLHAEMFAKDATYRRQRFSTCAAERAYPGGLIAQFCGNDPAVLLTAARLVEHEVDAVDLNLGCPQNIAQKGNYGSYLLRQQDTVLSIVRAWADGLVVPATCKVRLFDGKSPRAEERGLQGTLNFCRALEAAGASAICVHGRTREQKGFKVGASDWTAIAAVKRAVSIPVIANGGIETYSQVAACLESTGCDAVMSAEGLLEDPNLFVENAHYDFDYTCRHRSPTRNTSILDVGSTDTGPSSYHTTTNHTTTSMTLLTGSRTPTDFALEYLQWARKFPPSDFYKCVKAHVLKLVHRPLRRARNEAAGQSMGNHGAKEIISTAPASAPAAATTAATTEEPGSAMHTNVATTPGAVHAAVLGATNEAELEASVHALDSYMRHRGSNVPHVCPLCNISLVVDGDLPSPSELSLAACTCWRRDTWYQRHRDQVIPAGGKKRQSETQAPENTGVLASEKESKESQIHPTEASVARRTSRKELKDMRRLKYKAMGYNV